MKRGGDGGRGRSEGEEGGDCRCHRGCEAGVEGTERRGVTGGKEEVGGRDGSETPGEEARAGEGEERRGQVGEAEQWGGGRDR